MKRRACGWSDKFLMEVIDALVCYVRWPCLPLVDG